ncbi:MAG TPA: GNAT family N-acetyltransferase [Bryobacteraceae bacterium]|nr:GNAT family N-acetyltransferase [Bryobacteraceae bacterium]
MPPNVQIRRLYPADAQACWRLRLQALESDPAAFGEDADEHRKRTVAEVAGRLASDWNCTLGAFDGPDLIGMVGVGRQERAKRKHVAHIWGMFVAPGRRGSGIGRALVLAAIEHARSLPGLRKVQLSVITTQPAARALYQSLGFRSFGIDPEALFVDGKYLDEEFMYLPLRSVPCEAAGQPRTGSDTQC